MGWQPYNGGSNQARNNAEGGRTDKRTFHPTQQMEAKQVRGLQDQVEQEQKSNEVHTTSVATELHWQV